MKLEPPMTLSRPSAAASARARGGAKVEVLSPLAGEATRRLHGEGPRYVAAAPVRLDIMGGVSEYCGALVLGMTAEDHVCAAAQKRNDGKISLSLPHVPGESNGRLDWEIAAVELHHQASHSTGESGDGAKQGKSGVIRRCVLGALVEGLRANVLPAFQGGMALAAASTLGDLTTAGGEAALTVATLVSAAAALNRTPTPEDGVSVCRKVRKAWLGRLTGAADPIVSSSGERFSLIGIRSDAGAVDEIVPLPDGLQIAGVDLGSVCAETEIRFGRVRTAAFMGRLLIDRIIQHDELRNIDWDGHLSGIRVSDFVSHFRDRLPTKIMGADFLEKFGETGDPLTTIDPSETYKIRSRTEHHIYEHARSLRLSNLISQWNRDVASDDALVEAGELLAASHWSYGQRCGLGCAEADRLVTLIRRHGRTRGIFGAKITSCGCGGTVAVLMRSTDEAADALNEAVNEYSAGAARSARIFSGSRSGALVEGARSL